MPRNVEVMALCDEHEKLLASSSAVEHGAVNATVAGSIPASSAKPPFDRKSYMRDYMKQRRAQNDERQR